MHASTLAALWGGRIFTLSKNHHLILHQEINTHPISVAEKRDYSSYATELRDGTET